MKKIQKSGDLKLGSPVVSARGRLRLCLLKCDTLRRLCAAILPEEKKTGLQYSTLIYVCKQLDQCLHCFFPCPVSALCPNCLAVLDVLDDFILSRMTNYGFGALNILVKKQLRFSSFSILGELR
jgi:hypothetical protein